MAKETASFKIRPELKKALNRVAEKERRTLSWFLEQLVEDVSKKRKYEKV